MAEGFVAEKGLESVTDDDGELARYGVEAEQEIAIFSGSLGFSAQSVRIKEPKEVSGEGVFRVEFAENDVELGLGTLLLETRYERADLADFIF